MSDHCAFWNGEGDAWWTRNQAALENPARLESDPILRALELLSFEPRQVLEVGAANGFRLEALRARFGCATAGIEVSEKAVEDGQRAFPSVNLVRAPAHQIPFEDARFDLVVVSFVLHWIERSLIWRTFAELDRVLEEDGRLIIADFAPSSPQKVAYHHAPDQQLWTWKQDYAAPFLASKLCGVEAQLMFDHASSAWGTSSQERERAAVWVLRKNAGESFVEAF